jgi:cytochrome P450
MRQDDLDITDPGFFAEGDPHAILARWRRDDPVHWTQGHLSRGFWSVTRYKDSMRVFVNDNKIFSLQQYGSALPQNADIDDEAASLYIRLLRSGAALAVMDGTPHTLLRKVFSERFTIGGIAAMEALIRGCVEEIMNDVLPRGSCDFTVDIGGRLPLAVISAMMDIPRGDWDDLYRWNNMTAAPEDPEWSIGTALETSSAGTAKLIEYCARLGRERRAGTADDLMSLLAHAEIDGQPLSDDQLGFNGLMFFGAGHETTRASLSAGVLELMKDPAQLARLVALRHDPAALDIAADEFVRWTSPLTHALRTATADITIGDQLIKKGDWVVVWYISANRDADAFVEPDRFDIARTPNRHLGYAVGKHHCLGAHLARAEMRIMLEYLLEYMPDMKLAGDVEMAASNHFWGIKHMPVTFPPRAGVASR